MTTEQAPEKNPDAAEAPKEREPHIPRPPTREEVERISRDQVLITDEWAGEEPGAAGKQERKPSG